MLLKIQSLSKSFKENKILDDIGFELSKGEIACIIGKSGAGKTTLLRCINGLERCDSGSIIINGKYLCRESDRKTIYPKSEELRDIRKSLGMVFQSFNLFPHMTVFENVVEAPIKAFGESREECEKKAMELLSDLGLTSKASSYPFELSGGEKQRAAIARACILRPKIMCFDEPTSALDPSLTEEVAEVIKKLAKRGMAVLVITHDMFFAEKVGERIIYLQSGRVKSDTDKNEFFNSLKISV